MMLPLVPYVFQSNASWIPRENSGLGALPFGLFPTGLTDYQNFTWKEWGVIAGAAYLLFGRRR